MSEGYTKPFALNLIRVGATALLLWLLFIFKPVKSYIKKEDLGRLSLCALTGIAINQLLFVKGLSYTYPIHASLLMLSTPILITFLAAWLLNEKLNVYKIAGLILGIAGAVVLITSKAAAPPGTNVILGDSLILMNAVAYTFYMILVKPLMSRYNPIVIIRSVFTIGFFMMLPFCWQEFAEVEWGSFDTLAWANLASVVITGTFLAYLFNVYGIKILGAAMAGTYIYSQPFVAAFVAIIFLGESLTIYKILAAICIFLGVFLSNKKENAK